MCALMSDQVWEVWLRQPRSSIANYRSRSALRWRPEGPYTGKMCGGNRNAGRKRRRRESKGGMESDGGWMMDDGWMNGCELRRMRKKKTLSNIDSMQRRFHLFILSK